MSPVTRRGALSLIGSTSALLAAPVVAKSTVTCPVTRARQAWEAFSAAMDDLAVGTHGWVIAGGARTVQMGRLDERDMFNVKVVRYAPDEDYPSMLVEHHHAVVGMRRDWGAWRDDVSSWEVDTALRLPLRT